MFNFKRTNPFTLRTRIAVLCCVTLGLPFIKKIKGRQNLAIDGPFILAANHASHIDWLFVFMRFASIMGRYIHTFATTKYYHNPAYRLLAESTQIIWMDVNVPARSIYAAMQYLKHGDIVAIFPEGTRSPDGKLQKGKTGAAALTLHAKVPVVPVGLIGTDKVLPKGAALPRFARCEANIGEPIKFDAFHEDYDKAVSLNDKEKILEIQEKVVAIIMKKIARLSGQEYPY